jgi:hypothetical protein
MEAEISDFPLLEILFQKISKTKSSFSTQARVAIQQIGETIKVKKSLKKFSEIG